MPQDNRPTDESHDDELCYEDPASSENVAALNPPLPGPTLVSERRQLPRMKYQAAGTLEPVATGGPDEVSVVTRDADPRGSGFVAAGGMPEGSRAVLHLPAPEGEGRTQRIECLVRRSRELGNGLFEGSVEFLGHQPQFSETRISATPYRPR